MSDQLLEILKNGWIETKEQAEYLETCQMIAIFLKAIMVMLELI